MNMSMKKAREMSMLADLMQREIDKPKTKFAPVAPARIYKGMLDAGFVPQQVLLLAHDVAANAKEYADVFSDPLFTNTNIIMDNSVVETGNAVDASMVFEAAEAVCADIVVLPDVLNDAYRSTEATLNAWEEWYWKFRDYKKMVLVQGATLGSWLHSAERLALEIGDGIDWIGIPRIAEDMLGGEGIHRYDLANFVSMIFPEASIHLFGFSESIHWDLLSAASPLVTSIDSAVPLRLKTKQPFSEAAGKRGDWWETAVFDDHMIEMCKLIDRRILGQ